ncbi:type II secretion system F family protein [Cohnella lubricantis]|uniref:Type II secretion system F family protein n=1 Tax=Cohnella lubricantis TaxID=2163172 RepID=A0A841TDK1_9BACL|nr:type II secretion system F family protein [Cohnella lubricantis]MBB6679523.1 type II secretion system F family protein [Cohnella lubricantis]MBP2119257.1 tight adherence protein C [Cohnella lubricantis]
MLYAAFCLTVTLAIYSLFVVREERSQKLKRRLALVTGAAIEAAPQPAEKSSAGREGTLLRRLALPLWREFRRGFGRIMEERKVAKLELKLLQAGRPFGMSPVDYRIVQLCLVIALPGLCVFYGYTLGMGFGEKFLMALLGIVIAIVLPGYYLRLKTNARSRLALRELPDVLDLLTVSLEAGLGFDAALNKLVGKKHGALADEFRRCLEEIRLGKTRREALSGVRDRLVLDELRVLINSILQAEKLGVGMVQVLRVQSQEVRDQRKQRAEEAAMKAPIKMLFPLVLFIFPSLFIVLLGPAAIEVITEFSK